MFVVKRVVVKRVVVKGVVCGKGGAKGVEGGSRFTKKKQFHKSHFIALNSNISHQQISANHGSRKYTLPLSF